jgi:hypothetical protein
MARECALTAEQLVKIDIERPIAERRVYGHRDMDCHRLRLPDTIDTIVTLIFNGRVPPAAEMNHVIRGCDSETDACGFWRQNHQVEAGVPSGMRLEFGVARSPVT